jgi:hypothetical protein
MIWAVHPFSRVRKPHKNILLVKLTAFYKLQVGQEYFVFIQYSTPGVHSFPSVQKHLPILGLRTVTWIVFHKCFINKLGKYGNNYAKAIIMLKILDITIQHFYFILILHKTLFHYWPGAQDLWICAIGRVPYTVTWWTVSLTEANILVSEPVLVHAVKAYGKMEV